MSALWLVVPLTIAGDPHPGLLDPSKANETAPETFHVKFETTKGSFVVKVTRELAPIGVDRFYNLVKIGYFQDMAFYRVIDGFMAQFGFSGDPKVNDAWGRQLIKDDPVKASNTPGMLTFANMGAPNTRGTQFFINTVSNTQLDRMRFAPFGEVEGDGLEVVKKLHSGYGEGAPYGPGPSQSVISEEGNAYLKEKFPNLDYILKVEILKDYSP